MVFFVVHNPFLMPFVTFVPGTHAFPPPPLLCAQTVRVRSVVFPGARALVFLREPVPRHRSRARARETTFFSWNPIQKRGFYGFWRSSFLFRVFFCRPTHTHPPQTPRSLLLFIQTPLHKQGEGGVPTRPSCCGSLFTTHARLMAADAKQTLTFHTHNTDTNTACFSLGSKYTYQAHFVCVSNVVTDAPLF